MLSWISEHCTTGEEIHQEFGAELTVTVPFSSSSCPSSTFCLSWTFSPFSSGCGYSEKQKIFFNRFCC